LSAYDLLNSCNKLRSSYAFFWFFTLNYVHRVVDDDDDDIAVSFGRKKNELPINIYHYLPNGCYWRKTI